MTHRPRPLPIGWMLLVLAVVLYIAGSNIGSGWVVVLTAAMVGALVLDLAAVWRAHRGLQLHLRSDATATTTAPTTIRIQVRAPDVGTTLQLAHDDGAARAVVRAPQAVVELTASLDRGHHRDVAISARTIGPLGLVHARRRHVEPADTWVRPGVVPADGRVVAVTAALGAAARRPTSGQEEVRGVREFTSRDPRRSVHWRATARQGRLMVRDRESPPGAPLRLTIAGGTWPHAALDLATIAVASLAETATRRGQAVEVDADGTVAAWDDEAAHRLAALPPAVGIPSRPLRDPATPEGLVLTPGPDGGVVVTEPSPAGAGTSLPDLGAVTRWLRGQP